MSTANKYMQSASGVGGAALDVDEVFSTYLYTGTGSTQTISNGIDLDGEGGLVWVKKRVASASHGLYDTERGASKLLISENTNAQATYSGVSSFLSTGFGLGSGNEFNQSGQTFASWTFRKAEKFFDVVTYTGNGANRAISHNLGQVPGFIIVKSVSASDLWECYHRSLGPTQYIRLDSTNAAASAANNHWQSTTPTSTEFYVGTTGALNTNGVTYVAYVFAHNDSDGEFGPDADADIIKCGSYTTNSNGDASINLGFEPQWVLLKRTDSAQSWWLADTMRGMPVGTAGTAYLAPDQSAAEDITYTNYVNPTATGFDVDAFSGSATYIYIAIRRGPLAPPESATDVFDIDVSTASQPYSVTTSLNYVDATINRVRTSGQAFLHNRLTGSKWMFTDSTNAESNSPNDVRYDFNGKVMPYFYTSGDSHANYMWKRAPNYMDVVAFTGTGADRTLNHNLGVAPEMMWVKDRSHAGYDWMVYHTGLNGGTNPEQYYIQLNRGNQNSNTGDPWNDTAPTSSVFSVGNDLNTNRSGHTYIAYLFASLAGISKIGSVTHSGTTNVDCGFSAGASLVMLKRTDATGDWYWWDSTSGIVSGNDPYFTLNGQAAQVTNTDLIDPLSSGFTITSSLTAGDYIFYAIA